MSYANLGRITDQPTRDAFKVLADQISTLQRQIQAVGTVSVPLTAHLDAGQNKLTKVADPTAALDAVNLRTLIQYVQVALRTQARATSAAGGGGGDDGGGGGGGGSDECHLSQFEIDGFRDTFETLSTGANPAPTSHAEIMDALLSIQGALSAAGIEIQHDSGGNLRPRIYLANDEEFGCGVDIESPSFGWAWVQRGF